MRIPEGMNEDQHQCLQSNKTIYVYVQSITVFYKKLILVLKSIGFVGKKVRSVFVVKWERKIRHSRCLFVYDCFVHWERREHPMVDC
jgi:hypothetical protein